MALEGQPPFKGVLTHGFVVDGEGRKMSKSAGNVVSPQEVMKEFGADILRLWVSSCDYQFDVRLSKEILKQLADQYRKIRNTFRYLLSNLYDFNPDRDAVALEKLHPLDLWAAASVEELVREVSAAYEAFAFHQIYRSIHDFCSVDLSAYYFDILKDTLYTARRDSPVRRSAQSALFRILSKLVRLAAPIMPFTADEVWRSFTILPGSPSVHTADFSGFEELAPARRQEISDWEKIRAIRNAITPFLEKKREAALIGSSLDAKVGITASDPGIAALLQTHLKDLPRVFIVSQVEWLAAESEGTEEAVLAGMGTLKVLIARADGAKCVRCWNYSAAVGGDAAHPGLCTKCLDAVK